MTSRTILVTTLAVAVIAAAFGHSRSGVDAQSLPAAKTAVAMDRLIGLTSGTTDPLSPQDTGWVDVLQTQIKTSRQKDLLFDVSMQCGIVTDTTVRSKDGGPSSASARANIAVRVLVDGIPAEPTSSIDATRSTVPGVVFCDRVQTLAAKFAGLNCTADLTTGAITCADPEELQLILQTLNANAFNFAMTDVGVGVHSVKVQARAQASVTFDNTANLAGAEAFAGAGSVVVEEVRLVKGAQIIDLQ